jgi:hypothetical protein
VERVGRNGLGTGSRSGTSGDRNGIKWISSGRYDQGEFGRQDGDQFGPADLEKIAKYPPDGLEGLGSKIRLLASIRGLQNLVK